MSLKTKTWQERLEECGVIAVLTIEKIEDAIPTAKALIEGGITGMELTLRTPIAYDALKLIRTEVPEMLAGVGTVISPQQVQDLLKIGVDFAVSPGVNIRVIQSCKDLGLPFAPGVMSPSDIETALEYDYKLLKYFPAETAGGLKHLQAMATPYKHLGIKFIPLGGINITNCHEYLAHPLVAAIGGSWIAPQKLIQDQDWQSIKINAKKTRTIIDQTRK